MEKLTFFFMGAIKRRFSDNCRLKAIISTQIALGMFIEPSCYSETSKPIFSELFNNQETKAGGLIDSPKTTE